MSPTVDAARSRRREAKRVDPGAHAGTRPGFGATGRAEIWILLVVVGVLGGGLAWGLVTSDSNRAAPEPSRRSSTTSLPPVTLPSPRPYKVLAGVNLRAGPGTSYDKLGVVDLGHEVLVVCSITGETVDSPSGPTNTWVRVLVSGTSGYVAARYVETRNDLNDRSIIGVCASV